jgi:hypothetical protein
MTMKLLSTNRRSLLFVALNCAVAGSLPAQFIISNSQEAQGYGAVINQGHTALSSASDFALGSLSAAPGFHVGYHYDDADADRDGADRAFDTNITHNSGNLAYVHQFEEFVASLSVSYIDSDTEAKYSDSGNVGEVKFDGDGWVVSAAAADTWEQLTLSVVGGFGQISNDGTRQSSTSGLGKSDSSFDTDLYYFTIDANYDVVVSERLTVAPFVRLNYLNVSSDSFTEKGGAGPGKVDSIDRDWITSELGLRSFVTVSDALSASLALSWEYDFDSSDTKIAGYDTLGNYGGLDVPDVGENRFKAIVGLDYSISEDWALSGALSYTSGDEYDAFGAGGALSYTF